MAPDPQCAALSAAMKSKNVSYSQVAQKIGQPEQHVVDICTGKVKATTAEFNALAVALDIHDVAPHDAAHATS